MGTDHRFVFIAGLHRSGTTALFRCIREHPRISGFRDTGAPEDEGQHLQSVFPTGKPFGGPGIFGFDPNAALTEASPLVTDSNRLRLFGEWARHWDLDRPVLLEKSPPNLIRTRFLQAMFPESLFVILLRHPLVVSFATQKWSGTSIASLVEHWLVCHERFREDEPRLNRVLVCRYENFVVRPQEVLDEIYGFLELETHRNTVEISAHNDATYFRLWHAYREDPAQRDDATRLLELEARAERFGYGLDRGLDTAVSAAAPRP